MSKNVNMNACMATAIKEIELMGVKHPIGKVFYGCVTTRNGYPQFSTQLGVGCWVNLEIDDEVELP